MNDQQGKEFGFEEEDVFEEDEVFSVEDLDAGEDPVPEFEALAPGPGAEPAGTAKLRLDPEPVPEPQQEQEQTEPAPRKSSMSRLLLLILLLVVVAGGLFFYFGAEEPAPVAKIPVPHKQAIELPKPPPEPAVVTEQLQPVAEQGAPAPAVPQAPVAAEKTPAAPAPVAMVPAAPEKTPTTPAAAVEAQPVPAPVPAPAPPEPQPAASGDYRVQVGAYILPESLHLAERQVRKLGYQPQVATGTRSVEMTRLLYGRYPKGEAASRLAELKKHAPDAFMIHEGDQVSLYAGSYVSLDKARRFADLLYEKGMQLSEVPAKVAVPFYYLSIGPLPDHQTAAEVLKHLQQGGLEGQILKHSPEAKSSPQ